MRMLTALLLTVFAGIGGVLAQDPPPGMNSSVVVTVITSENGTNDNLILELSGTFPGDPVRYTLDQPGDLQPGMFNSYNFIVPHTFCEIFQFQLSLDGSDDWLGQQVSVQIDGAIVWYNSVFFEGGLLTPSNPRGGTWDRTDTYRNLCETIPVTVTTHTGADGTNDTPFFSLSGNFSASPYAIALNQPGDLQPGQTDTYSFHVPMSFCQLTGWQLYKGASGAVDDSWLPTQLTVHVDGDEVFYDGVFHELGPITEQSDIGGTWDGTAAYQDRCSLTIDPGIVLLPTATPLTIDPGILLLPTATPLMIDPGIVLLPTATPLTINPGIVLLPTATPLTINPGILLLPTATPSPSLGEPPIMQCDGAPAPRLFVGGQGFVTPGAPNRVRSMPTTSSAILGQIPPGGVFDVLDGPTCAEGYTWWQVNYNGIIGWTAEGTGAEYFIAPV